MSGERINSAFDLPLEQIEDDIGYRINGDRFGYDRVIPLRDLTEIQEASLFDPEALESLVRSIPLRRNGDSELVYPYKNATEIIVARVEPRIIQIGQTFVLEPKIFSISDMVGVKGKIGRFETGGLSKMRPMVLYGEDSEGQKAVAFYVPPIIEIEDKRAALLDGMHRSYICGVAGAEVTAVHVKGVSEDLPFEPIDWDDCKRMAEKPPKDERFRNLRMELFRDLGAVGIDG